ncbi:MAG: hypothetical protein AMXMBFR64_54170 [Myxococcales bacterium]
MDTPPLSPEARRYLLDALLTAFGSTAGARLLLRQAGVPVDLLDLSRPVTALWEDALDLALGRGQLEDLRASAAAHHPEAGAFTLPLDALDGSEASPVPPAPANVVRKLTRVLAGSLSARDRAALLVALGVEGPASDPSAAVEAIAHAGLLREAWDRIREERPRALTLPYPVDLSRPDAP